jgi:hypothetical protein
MKNSIPLALVVFAAVAAAGLRMAVRRPKPRGRGVESAPVTVMTGPPGPRRPASAVELGQDVFHELHADGRNAACTVCDSRYQAALRPLPPHPFRRRRRNLRGGGGAAWGLCTG